MISSMIKLHAFKKEMPKQFILDTTNQEKAVSTIQV